jgi:hypothetical protein
MPTKDVLMNREEEMARKESETHELSIESPIRTVDEHARRMKYKLLKLTRCG